jgi:hypothetical protein
VHGRVATFSLLAACGRIDFAETQGSNGDADTGGDIAVVADAIEGATDCRILHGDDPSLVDGIYDVDLDGIGPAAVSSVYCDMTTAGGGWTLVGRSVTGGTAAAFGWQGATGSVSDDAAPYSLGPAAGAIAFTEILVASHSGTKAPAVNGYVVPAAADFVSAYAQSSLRSESTTAFGGCAPSPFVTMLLFKGQTDLAGVFWFRDSEFVGGTPHGLFPDHWDTFYANDCLQGGLLNGAQGVIYVR